MAACAVSAGGIPYLTGIALQIPPRRTLSDRNEMTDNIHETRALLRQAFEEQTKAASRPSPADDGLWLEMMLRVELLTSKLSAAEKDSRARPAVAQAHPEP